MKQCNSPYIVGYKGAFQKSSNIWIILEYCPGGSLTDMMQINQRTFSEAQVALIMKHALNGLAYLHQEKKIHRDIKGGNILVTEDGTCKLADFGVSSNLDKTLGKNRTVIGTPHYMAPEVLTNDDYDEKADIWSLAITAYELVIGEPPHARLHSMRAAIKIPTAPPPTLPEPHRFSQDFHHFLASALVKDFRHRPSATELLTHPFILKAPDQAILLENVRASIAELESRHESLSEIHGLMNMSSKSGKSSRSGFLNSSSLRDTNGSHRSQGSNSLDTLDPSDFDDLSASMMGSSATIQPSDTMVIGGGNSDTMVMAGSGSAKNLPPLAIAAASTTQSTMDQYGTMIMDGEPISLSDSIIISAASRCGISSVSQSEAAETVAALKVSSPTHKQNSSQPPAVSPAPAIVPSSSPTPPPSSALPSHPTASVTSAPSLLDTMTIRPDDDFPDSSIMMTSIPNFLPDPDEDDEAIMAAFEEEDEEDE